MFRPRNLAGIIADLARAADIRANGIDRARGCLTHAPAQRQAAVALAMHTREAFRDKSCGDQRERRLGFQGEARPPGIRSAARSARLTRRDLGSGCGTAHSDLHVPDAKKPPLRKGGSKFHRINQSRLSGLDVANGDLAGATVFLGVELHLLTFHEAAHASALEGRGVNEHILATVVGSNEAEAFLIVVELDGTGIHELSFLIDILSLASTCKTHTVALSIDFWRRSEHAVGKANA
jgi:hypothetical protein